MNINPKTQVKDIGEQGLLPIIQRFCPGEIIGDDAAVISVDSGQLLVITTDVLVDKVHFSEETTPPESVGWRAVVANLSDLAAMGASPLGITVGLALPGEVTINWIENLYQGMSECLQKYNTKILGGDLCRSGVISISITAFGQVLPNRVIRRFSAQVDDPIIVTGYHGNSRGGLELLLNNNIGKNLDKNSQEYLIKAHQKPEPRLDILKILNQINDQEFRIAGMDSSDGLADAIIQICRCSGVGAEIDANLIPLSASLLNLGSPQQALEWALYGGEDFELVLTLPYYLAEKLVKNLGKNAAIIGKITTDKQVKLIDSKGKYPERVLTLAEGFQHFSTR